ncbi:hypothetical protein [Laspinema olomoucense]|uniref:Uncharacterized protein n=1 Tax=Laspinema olomoucense D3b TaxID=2953688 RepID=A0ABT2ND33_9CYAN|nr:hypothetical protein [Laspinema sp. D3b]MCT7980605.1 hypothetical protein [Laspinema sp. D3b]
MHPDGYIPAPKRREFFKLLAIKLLTIETFPGAIGLKQRENQPAQIADCLPQAFNPNQY